MTTSYKARRVFDRILTGGMLFFIARLLLGSVFVYASLDKIIHPKAFAVAIHNYQLLPDRVINITALVLPWLELILGSLLLLGLWLPGAAGLATTLLIVFFSAYAYAAVRGLDIHCGCFSTTAEGKSDTLATLIRDLCLLTLGCYISYRVYFQRVSQSR